ncbi:MAG: signal transduction histidine kinase/CheY-like chemotaxis protein [Arenicella sp.]|jgi:signal transduction histidine kinase/CheY-like chemotaxis protein
MMFLLPKPPSDVILSQELKLAGRNYLPGTILYTATCGFSAYWSSTDVASSRAMSLVIALSVLTAICCAIYYRGRSTFGDKPRIDLIKLLLLVAIPSLNFTYLIYHFVPIISYEAVLTLTAMTLGLAAGGVTLTSPMLPAFYTMTYPSLMVLVVSLYHRPESIFFGLAIGCFGMTLGLTWFAITMASTIRRSIEIAFQNEALVHKLRASLNQTDEANRAKSVFLASASHDLRQPLHALGLLTETLGGTKLDEQQNDIQAHMMSAVDSTRGMLDSLLNMSKLDAGAIMASPKPFLVQSIFYKLEDELAPIADENQLIYRTRETIAAAYSDPMIVELILRNLIANAIRYTDSGGILVGCRPRGSSNLSIEVWDTGVGIPEDKIEDMFREFQQLENPERDAQKGFGLGLAIAQGLATTLDSKIEVQSILGRGSVFSFELPRSNASVIEDLPSDTRITEFNRQKVIVIDDDERVRLSMHSLMESWGCECISAESAEEILIQIADEDTDFDLLLVDYRLREGKTGREAIKAIRAYLGKQIPAIIITGDTASNRIAEAQSSDALLLHKPVSTSQLRRIMASMLSDSEYANID